MQCVRPLYFDNLKQTVACGKCIGCRLARINEWGTRMMHENNYHEKSTFVTLTYRDEDLPANNSVDKRELQLFFKRLRQQMVRDGCREKIKYFACGEYGETNGRPHYHAIIFGIGLSEYYKKLIQDTWGHGRTQNATVTMKSCKYVAKYIQKIITGEKAKEKYAGREAPFRLLSKALGKEYALSHAEQIKADLRINVDGRMQSIPRYYRKVLKIDEIDYEQYFTERLLKKITIYKKRNIQPLDEYSYQERVKDYKEETLKRVLQMGKPDRF